MTGRSMLALTVGLVGCGSRTPEVPAPEAASSSATLVTLEREPCFGTCPVYRVSLDGGGKVDFVGTRFVSREGADTSRVPADEVVRLVDSLDAAGYFALADQYVPDSPACGRYATDAPTVTISVQSKGRSKTVRHDHGCVGAPAALTGMERLIDSVAGTGRWTAR
ncbi:MAG TPA: DUF6438 domain-containing protein [Gemmatimonadales bacterium]|nr:DUF6438 domain-containing protein [Gemmatimonadales bacterium]